MSAVTGSVSSLLNIVKRNGFQDEKFNLMFCKEFADINTKHQDELLVASSDLGIDMEFWICLNAKDKPIGRVGASISAWNSNVGYVGFFGVDLSEEDFMATGIALLSTASSWIKSRNIHAKVFGPVNLSTYFNYRFRTDNNQTLHSFDGWEPQNPPEYIKIFKKVSSQRIDIQQEFGFAPVQKHYSMFNSIGSYPSKFVFPSDLGSRFMIRSLKPSDLEDPVELHRITIKAFQGKPFFDPKLLGTITMFKKYYIRSMLLFVKDYQSLLKYSGFMMDKTTQQAVGFIIAWKEQNCLVLKSIAVDETLRGSRLDLVSFHLDYIRSLLTGDPEVTRFMSALVEKKNMIKNSKMSSEFKLELHREYTVFMLKESMNSKL